MRFIKGEELITLERIRQRKVENWTDKHDDAYTNGELIKAAACYIGGTVCPEEGMVAFEELMEIWPWEPHWFKPTTPLRDLTKAGALIAAEIDRRLRAGESI